MAGLTWFQKPCETANTKPVFSYMVFFDLIKAEAGMADEVPNDVALIENYVRATNYGFERLEILPLSLRLIREIHGILMEDVRVEKI